MLATIVIPIKNEEISLRELLPSLEEEIKKNKAKIEVILIDDASTDNSKKIIINFIKNKPNFHLIIRNIQGGQTGCYRSAFKRAKGKYIIRMDGDMQDSPKDIHQFIQMINEGNEIVVGIRTKQSHAFFNVFASRLFNLFTYLLFKSPFFDNTSSFVAFKASLIKEIPLKKTFFFKNEHRYLVLIAISKSPKKYTEIIINHQARKGGASKYRKFVKYYSALIETLILFLRIKRGYYKSK